jgi:hypothetical protein
MRFAFVVPSLIALSTLSSAGEAQAPPRLLFTMGVDDDVVLADVRAAVRTTGRSIVLSAPAPAIHSRTDAGDVRAWGSAGEGPGEYRDPVDLTWGPSGGLVLDQTSHRLTAYDATGRLLWSRSSGADWANRVRIVNADTLLQLFEPMGMRRAVVRIRGAAHDTILRYELTGTRVRIESASGPSLTVRLPFSPATQWTEVPGIGIAVWSPEEGHVRIQSLSGTPLALLPLPSERVSISRADREWWFAATFGASFAGRRGVFSGLIPEARRRIEFPQHFPRVTALLASPDGTVWARRSSPGAGEAWFALSQTGGPVRRIVLPAGREAIAFGNDVVLARGASADDEPIVEGWSLP